MLRDPVSVAQYQGGAGAAEALRSALEAAGIPAFTAGHDLGELLGWVRVYVSAADRERAEAVIAEMEAIRRSRQAVEEGGVSVVCCLACRRPMSAERCRHCGWSWLDGSEEVED
jgi:ribosomal protein L40E